jgi:hypothetical protein
MIAMAFSELTAIAQQRNVAPYVILDELTLTEMNLIPLLQMNTLTEIFEFNHEGKILCVEADYTVQINPNLDGVEIIDEVMDREGKVVEVKNKVVLQAMRNKFSEQIEAIREDLKAEKKSPLRDFGARVF